MFNENWSVLFTYGFQQQHTNGAWDEDPTLSKLTVERFGPEQNLFETNMADLHIEGDVGIGDLVFASAFWNQERRQWDEYSQYEQNYNAGAGNTPRPATPAPRKASPASTIRIMAVVLSRAVTRRRSSTLTRSIPSAGRTSCGSHPRPGGRFHWLVGGYWQVTNDHNFGEDYFMPGLQYKGAAFQTSSITTRSAELRCRPVSGTRTPRPVTTSRPANSPTSVSTSPTS